MGWVWITVQRTNRNPCKQNLVAPGKVLRKAADKLAAMRHALLKTEKFHFALSIPVWYMLSSKRLSIKKTMFA